MWDIIIAKRERRFPVRSLYCILNMARGLKTNNFLPSANNLVESGIANTVCTHYSIIQTIYHNT